MHVSYVYTVCVCVCVCVCVAQLYQTLSDPMNLGRPGSSVHVTHQARILQSIKGAAALF